MIEWLQSQLLASPIWLFFLWIILSFFLGFKRRKVNPEKYIKWIYREIGISIVLFIFLIPTFLIGFFFNDSGVSNWAIFFSIETPPLLCFLAASVKLWFSYETK